MMSTHNQNEVTRLEQLAWLLDNIDSRPRHPGRLEVLWAWAGEMADFQAEANRTGKAIAYRQRGEVLRTLHPVREAA